MEQQQIDKALKSIFELLSKTNVYIDKQAPWKLKNENISRMNTVLSVGIEIIKRISLMTLPIMPAKSEKILNILNYIIK